MNYKLSASEIRELIVAKLSHNFGVTPAEATDEHYYKAVVLILRDLMTEGRKEFIDQAEKENRKQVCYLCMEFLMGRSLRNNLYNLGLEDAVSSALSSMGLKLENIYNQEPDAGLGNGGLGRLAACFLDGWPPRNIRLWATPCGMNMVFSVKSWWTAGRLSFRISGCPAAPYGCRPIRKRQ